MKPKQKPSVATRAEPTEDEIRDYAYHLYQQSGCAPGHDLENWLEAKACLAANIPKQQAQARLHRHRHPETGGTLLLTIEAEAGTSLDPFGDRSDDEVTVQRVVLLNAPD